MAKQSEDTLELFEIDEETFQALLDILEVTEEERIEYSQDRKTRFQKDIH